MNDQPHFIDSNLFDQDDPLSQMKEQEQQTSQDHPDVMQLVAQVIADFQSDLEYLRDR